MTRSRVCRSCGALKGPDELRCSRCGAVVGWSALADRIFRTPAVATHALLAICCLDFAYLVLLNGSMPFAFGLGPKLSAMVQAGGILDDFATREPWRLLSAVYGHLSLLHLGMNMLALVQLGKMIEAHLGSARLLLLFTITGVLGFVVSGIWYGTYSPPTAGASGALFGFLGYQIGILYAQKDPRARQLLFQQLAFALAFALLVPVNNAAHFGGLVSGFGLGWLFFRERRPARFESLARVLAIACLVLAVLSIVLSARSPLVETARHRYDAVGS